MFASLLRNKGAKLKRVSPKIPLNDKRIVLKSDNNTPTHTQLQELGARDVLVLTKSGNKKATRRDGHVTKKITRLADIRKNNCNLAILHGKTAFAITQKHYFSQFDFLLVRNDFSLFLALPGLLRYCSREHLSLYGITTLPTERGVKKEYLVIKSNYVSNDQRKQYGPSGLSPAEILNELNGLNYVLLRWLEDVESGKELGDMDLLVDKSSIDQLKERFGRRIGTFPMDIYADDGSNGHFFKRAPYFTPKVARAILDSASPSAACQIKTASHFWRYISFCYHLLFHNKTKYVCPGKETINRDTFQSPHYYEELDRLASVAGEQTPGSFTELENQLKRADAFPSLDLIGFYSQKNPFLKHRYFGQGMPKPGLATFFVRDFHGTRNAIPEIRENLKKHFRILVEGDVDEELKDSILKGVRGGNWSDPQADSGLAEPIHWFVCWDDNPKKPSAKLLRKHPFLDNEHVRLKDVIRAQLKPDSKKVPPIVHSSDNSLEAIDHLKVLGLENHLMIQDLNLDI